MNTTTRIRMMVPAAAKQADYGNSLRSAVSLKCLDCTCGQRAEIAACPSVACPLWRFRPYADDDARVRPDGVVPSIEALDAKLAERPHAGDGGAALAAYRQRMAEADGESV